MTGWKCKGGVSMKVLSWYRVPIKIRRFIGIVLSITLLYWLVCFSLKFLFFILYVGNNVIDDIFAYLIKLV